jgi:hypothetical protein
MAGAPTPPDPPPVPGINNPAPTGGSGGPASAPEPVVGAGGVAVAPGDEVEVGLRVGSDVAGGGVGFAVAVGGWVGATVGPGGVEETGVADGVGRGVGEGVGSGVGSGNPVPFTLTVSATTSPNGSLQSCERYGVAVHW